MTKLTTRDGIAILQTIVSLGTFSVCVIIVSVPIVRLAFTWSRLAGGLALLLAMIFAILPILRILEAYAASKTED
jgi:hypothetical protein